MDTVSAFIYALLSEEFGPYLYRVSVLRSAKIAIFSNDYGVFTIP